MAFQDAQALNLACGVICTEFPLLGMGIPSTFDVEGEAVTQEACHQHLEVVL